VTTGNLSKFLQNLTAAAKNRFPLDDGYFFKKKQ